MALITSILTKTRLLLSFAAALLIIFAMPRQANAGNGNHKDGKLNFCVSIRFNATEAQLTKIRDALQRGSDVFADATDGNYKFGMVSLINATVSGATVTPKASDSAEIWINPGAGRAVATYGKYGVRGEHINLYYDSNFLGSSGADGDSYTVAHEMAHHFFGLADEYSGPGIDDGADCATRPAPNTANYCLMDNYFKRGGRVASANYTLNEFCVRSNHDADRNTHQSNLNGNKSCWETVAAHPTRSTAAPAALPASDSPASQAVTFMNGFGGLRVVLVVDRSGSMSASSGKDEPTRMEFAKISSRIFINFLRIGDAVGVVDFDDDINVTFPLTTISNDGVKSAAMSVIDGLKPDGSTNIGDALLAAIGQLTSQPDRSCNEMIVLLTDGDHNTGTSPTAVIPQLKENRITVLTVGLGSGISVSGESLLRNIATQTAGKYFRVSSGFSLLGLSLELAGETRNAGLLARSPETISTGQTKEKDILVEAGAKSATFALAIADSKDALTMSLRSPSGTLINENTTAANVKFVKDANSKTFEVTSPEPGVWKIIVNAGAVTTGQIELLAFSENDGTRLNVSARKGNIAFPEEAFIEASLTNSGIGVSGANVAGTVTGPDGAKSNVVLFDDGKPEHGDLQSNDGIYTLRFSGYTKDGTYTFDLKADAPSTAVTVSGESLFDMDPPNIKPVSPFTRSAGTAIVVSGVRSTFGLSVTPNSQSLTAGDSISFKIDVLSFVGFVQPITLSATLAPPNSGVALNLSSATVVPGNSSTLTVATTKTAAPGTFTVAIRGASGSIVNTANVTFDLLRGPTYTITSMTPSQTAVGQAPKKILLRGTGLPTSGTVFFDATSVTPKKMTATKTVIKTFPPDLFSTDRIISVRIVDANGLFSNTLQLTVGTGVPPSVSLSASPSTQNAAPGQTASYNVNINRQNFSGNVTLSVSGLPAGASGSFNPMTTAGNSSTLTVATVQSAMPGSYPLTINGTANGVNINPAAVTLVIEPSGSVRLSANPMQATVNPGQNAVYSVTIDRVNFTGTVNLSLNGLPANATASFNPQSTAGNSSTLTVTTASTTPEGVYSLTIEGMAAGMTVSPATVVLQVNSAPTQPTVRLSVSPSSNTINSGQSADYTVTLDRSNFAGAVDLTAAIRASAVPAGISVRFSQDPVTGNSSILTILTTSATPAGTYTFFLRGTASGVTVVDSPDFTLTVGGSQTSSVAIFVTPSVQTVRPGQSATYNVAFNRTNFAGPITMQLLIRAQSVPVGLSASLGQNPATGSSTTLTLSTTGALARGTYVFYIDGTAAGARVDDSPDFMLIVQSRAEVRRCGSAEV